MNAIILENQLYTAGIYIVLTILSILLFWNTLYIIKRKKSDHHTGKFFPKVSLIIPAHNESTVLQKTLRKIFNSNYPKKSMEVIVVDDGSTDDTAKIAKQFPVKLVRNKNNLGKCTSLNVGIKNASNEIILTTDADTEFGKNTVENLVKHFSDSKVGAVAGYYKVPENVFPNFSFRKLKTFLLLKFQSLEYLTFLFARRRQAAFDAVMVVPGAIGAFRKDVLEKIGGFDAKMLIEDYDATIKIHKAGYKIVCEKDAIAWTKPPMSVGELVRQRMRWYRGGFEVLAKHSDLIPSRHGFLPLVLGFEYITIFLQIIMFALIGGAVYDHFILMHETLLQAIFAWIYGFINLKPIDVFGGIIMATFFVGFAEACFSVRMAKDSFRKLLYYPIIGIYLSLLGFIWIYSLLAHVTKRKVSLKGHAWKTSTASISQ
jgi:cellulose synthase/poly-beta-1,6-N-acetylglucosamine synthase-like glycosyltransferase